MYEKILMAYDGSGTSKRAFEQALSLARLTGAKLCVARVVDLAAPLGMGLTYVPQELIAAYREESTKQLEQARSDAKAFGVDCETELLEVVEVTDTVADCLQRFARDWGAQLVVLGTHGRRGMKRAFLGSVAEQFLRTADCPVLLVHGAGASSADRG
ncbi:universal stress protein [Paraburkholderia sp.]|uniref:universal stress protein n=1 Tax=Paraburkholderia sp. TaxID=1926495 RepID=UPI0025FC6B1B|nr:universal stress protein [Paraburkholderia sp.]